MFFYIILVALDTYLKKMSQIKPLSQISAWITLNKLQWRSKGGG